MTEDIHAKMIAEREAKIEILKAEIKVLKEAQAMAKGENPAKSKTRTRPLKPMWADILCFIGAIGNVSTDAIEEYAEKKGYRIKNDTLRGQLSSYVSNGWLERVAPGVFDLTKEGEEKAGFEERKKESSSTKAPEPPKDFVQDVDLEDEIPF